MAYNPYIDQQPVNIIDPSGRLGVGESGISRFNFPYTPTVSNIINANYSQAATTHSNFQQAFFFRNPMLLLRCKGQRYKHHLWVSFSTLIWPSFQN